ncbi:IclR family transcriptional regulator domain-containing protein [Halomonas organivorans]|uniref:IclR family mhp operon transcriptional activator n=1 Tax=Halomonas organivorans TaxID=257772 RepID=A0A7W5BYM6_9GAMM|nr:helix-turn-helix domain-containing protein [Halomonas organivorans]MBB3141466.1 IclR family mhp operon transcriptional activator [Halomonas organivorans]
MNKKIRALERGLDVVGAINDADGPMSLGELHQATGLDRATILRILATLEDKGWVYRGMGDSRYRLTYKLHELGRHVSVDDAIAHAAAPVLDALQQQLAWPSDISVYDGDGMAIIETSRRKSAFVINREVVGYKPSMLQSAMGRAFLAYCDERTLDTILRRLRKKGGEDGRLAADLSYIANTLGQVREKGYAVRDPSQSSLPSETTEEFNAIAVPVIVLGDVQASLNIVWMKSAYKDVAMIEDHFFQYLKPAAEELSKIFHEHGIY